MNIHAVLLLLFTVATVHNTYRYTL